MKKKNKLTRGSDTLGSNITALGVTNSTPLTTPSPSVMCLTLILRNRSLNTEVGSSSVSIDELWLHEGVLTRSTWPGFGLTGRRLSSNSGKTTIDQKEDPIRSPNILETLNKSNMEEMLIIFRITMTVYAVENRLSITGCRF